MTYRDAKDTWDETSDGSSVVYPESFVVCEDCGVGVYDTEVHDRFHEELNKLLGK
jgi:hypothetical protein